MSDNKNMSYKFKNGKYTINKDGVYFSVLPEQIPALREIVANIQAHNKLVRILGVEAK